MLIIQATQKKISELVYLQETKETVQTRSDGIEFN